MADEVGGSPISCSFLIGTAKLGFDIVQLDVAVPTGAGAWRMRLRSAAQNAAIEQFSICRMWAMPHLVHDRGDWLVYEHNLGAEQGPVFLERLPTREAAEMWMLHRGD